MTKIINDKLYDSDTSEVLVNRGLEQAYSRQDGHLELYRSPKGALWGRFAYWPNAYSARNVTWFADKYSAKQYAQLKCTTEELIKIFGEVEEG